MHTPLERNLRSCMILVSLLILLICEVGGLANAATRGMSQIWVDVRKDSNKTLWKE